MLRSRADSLAPTVAGLCARPDAANAQAALDHIVVELSGVADPTNVVRNLNAGGIDVEP